MSSDDMAKWSQGLLVVMAWLSGVRECEKLLAWHCDGIGMAKLVQEMRDSLIS